ncbi:ATP-binding region, ATPase-like [Ectocarpus siliculosus]|uniref:ATP-binding region, ATPase-like n=1 Tax=Ectocarpus siliculosus TaxID=2880 RepID=D7G701_ECTSI|nr:ATP-binding region, ATPase-like [Ectocarpus siliculosus]|eukprot:CBJ25694.1 ATP-binding region, ATPase-like [Ectocarpus siliculosus]
MSDHPSTAPAGEKVGLAKKLANAVLLSTGIGLCSILALYVALMLNDVPEWGAMTREVMIETEMKNIDRLALAKAEHTGEIYARVKENLLLLQAVGEQILLTEPETVVVDDYVKSFSGLQQQAADDWNHSTWFITGFNSSTDLPAAGSSLDGLLNRTALMDVPFRGMQRQQKLAYLAALDNPSLPDDPDESANFQAYPAFDMLEAGLPTYNNQEDCDDRFDTGDADFLPATFDPRCRVWFQDARESNGPIFTDPYQDWETGLLTVTPAAPVYDANGTTLLGVVGIDMNFSVIRESVLSLRIVEEDGYAYILTPTGDGVVVHPDLELDDVQNILELEDGVDEDEFSALVTRMTENCDGTASYQKNGGTWLLSWEHETISGSGTGNSSSDGGVLSVCSTGGFIIVVTVSEAALLGVFSETESDIRQMVMVASIIMAIVMGAIACITIRLARSLSKGLTNPVNQLVDIVRQLNNLDFSREDAGRWMFNESSCPEVEELMDAFKTMTTVVKFANEPLESGDVDAAQQNNMGALTLFKKLKNARGVAIVNNNMGNVYTLQAKVLSEKAGTQRENKHPAAADKTMRQADEKFQDAVISFRLAIEDAEMLISWTHQNKPRLADVQNSAPLRLATTALAGENQEKIEQEHKAGEVSRVESLDIEAQDDSKHSYTDDENDDDDDDSDAAEGPESVSALKLQLANRKFNLALCLAAKATGDGDRLRGDNEEATRESEEARRLMRECEDLAAERDDAIGTERQVEYLLALAALELSLLDRKHEAIQALERAETIIDAACSQPSPVIGTLAAAAATEARAAPPAVLKCRLLTARGEERLAAGDAEAAVRFWTEAVVGGDVMDPAAVRQSLVGLQAHLCSVDSGQELSPYTEALARGLGLASEEEGDAKGVVVSNAELTGAIQAEVKRMGGAAFQVSRSPAVKVDLCFVMDCTGSMGSWINQAKKKLFAIIEQTKKDIANLELRVAFVGYRDFEGHDNQYEGPYDFHSEEQLPQLEAKLKKISAGGGCGYVADVAGGLKHATTLSWSSPVRLCILFADAPCHGKMYHDVPDQYPKGCPKGVDPSNMIYQLHKLGVDFYFIRIAQVTDKMVDIFQSSVRQMAVKHERKSSPSPNSSNTNRPKFVVHNLGSDDNSFVDTVVESVVGSTGINLRMEKYS